MGNMPFGVDLSHGKSTHHGIELPQRRQPDEDLDQPRSGVVLAAEEGGHQIDI